MSTTSFFTLYESASGFALFSVLESEEIGSLLDEVSSYFILLLLILYYYYIKLNILIYRFKLVLMIFQDFKELLK